MKTVKVKKDELLEKLQTNLTKHKGEVEEAKKGYKKLAKETLEALLEKVNSGKEFGFRELVRLNEPMDKTEEYEQAIEMLKMEVEDVVEISDQDFRNFVQDKWDWKDSAFLANTKYLNI